MEGNGGQTPPGCPHRASWPALISAAVVAADAAPWTGPGPHTQSSGLPTRGCSAAVRCDPEAQRSPSALTDQPVGESEPRPREQSPHHTAAPTPWLLPWGAAGSGVGGIEVPRNGSDPGVWAFPCQSQGGPGKTGQVVPRHLGAVMAPGTAGRAFCSARAGTPRALSQGVTRW